MATFVNDTFTDTNAVLLENHTGETGATWAKITGLTGAFTINANRIYCSSVTAGYYASGSPANADYDVTASIYFASTGNNGTLEILARQSTGAVTGYGLRLERVSSGGGTIRLALMYWNAGSGTSIGTPNTYTITPAAAETHTLKLTLRGTALTVLYDDTSVITATHSSISAAGKVGVRGATAYSTTTGWHVDSLTAADPITATPAFPGTGALTAAKYQKFAVAKSLPGAGALTATAVATKFTLSKTLTGAGALTATARAKFLVAKTLPGTGALTVTRSQKFFVVKTLPGTGALTATAFAKFLLTKSLPGVGTLTAPIKVKLAAALPGTGALTAQIVPKLVGGLSGTGVLTATAEPPPGVPVSAALPGTGVLSAAAWMYSITRSAALPGTGALAVTRYQVFAVAKTLAGVGVLSAAARMYSITRSVALAGTGTLSATARAKFTLTRSFTGSGALTGAARMYQIRVTAARTGTGTLTAITVIRFQRPSPLPGSGLVTLTHQPVSVLTETFAAEDDAKWDFHGGLVVAGQLKLG